jgi:hypothetical protein
MAVDMPASADGDSLVPICPNTPRIVTRIPISEAVFRRSHGTRAQGATTARVAHTRRVSGYRAESLRRGNDTPCSTAQRTTPRSCRMWTASPEESHNHPSRALVRRFRGRGVIGESLRQIGAVPPSDRHAMHRSPAACRRTAHAKRENREPQRRPSPADRIRQGSRFSTSILL